MYVGTDDGFELFHSDKELINLDHGSSSDITIQFVPLKLNTRHCCVVLSDKGVGDIVFSITGVVNKPLPLLPETLHSNHFTVVNSETRTLHLSATANSTVNESLIIRNPNLSLENALLEITKWKMNENDLKRRLLTESLRYAALSNGVSSLQQKNFLDTCNETALIFNVEGSDNTHFIFPGHVKVPIVITGICNKYCCYW